MYRTEREEEVKVLYDPRVRKAASALGIEVVSFSDVRTGRPGAPTS